MPGYNCTAQCFEAWYAAHLTTCITQSSRLCYNDIFKVLKFSCSDRDRFQRKNTVISRTMGSLKVCLKYAGFTFTHSTCGDGTFFMAGVPTPLLLTCHDTTSCKASASGTGGCRLKTQVKLGR